MSLAPGTRLGTYEITGFIGAGGMGEVYRATDTSLKRQVAIKVLPEAVSVGRERLARFQREAELLASLNHPNIAHLYGLEHANGMQALVMELVEGPTLADRIAKSAIPIEEALKIAKQISQALEAAHEQGIIHRDLKPANVKLRSDGTVKVLDFGLAKVMEPPNATSQSASTLSVPATTETGMILGTPAYMSPEQARGEPADKRSDVWAFGCVLFEMLAGLRPFVGKGVMQVLGAVVDQEPQWDAIPSTVPQRVSQVLRVCLRKDPKQRVQAIGDVRLALEGAFETDRQRTISSVPSSAPTGRRWLIAALTVSVLAMLAMAVPTVQHLREAPQLSSPEIRTDVVTPPTADPESFALSPDGTKIVFVVSNAGMARVWLRSLADTAAHPLAGTDGASSPFWSPDSRSIAFYADGRLKRLDLGGGTPQILSPAAGGRGGSWSTEGVILFSHSSGPLLRVDAGGGQVTPATTLERQSNHRSPSFLPDGRHFLFLATGATEETTGLYLGGLDSPARRLTPSQMSGVYLSPGWVLWIRGNTLVAQRLNLERMALAGEPVVLADSLAVDPFALLPVSVSSTGVIAYRAGVPRRRQLIWFGRSGETLGTLGSPDENLLNNPRISPDGRRIVLSRAVQGNSDIWMLDGVRTTRLTFDPALEQFPVWSADGGEIVFQSDRKGARNVYRKSSSGAGTEDLLLESEQITVPSDSSADGRFLLYYSIDPKSARDLWVLEAQEKSKPQVLLNTPFEERWAVFSPNGRWMAYMSDESGRSEIYVRPFRGLSSGTPAGADRQWQVSTAGGIFPRWRRDGKELFYLGPAGEMLAVPIAETGATLTPGEPVTLFPTRIVGGGVDNTNGPQYDVAHDGRFLINTELDRDNAPITLVMNWNPAAKK